MTLNHSATRLLTVAALAFTFQASAIPFAYELGASNSNQPSPVAGSLAVTDTVTGDVRSVAGSQFTLTVYGDTDLVSDDGFGSYGGLSATISFASIPGEAFIFDQDQSTDAFSLLYRNGGFSFTGGGGYSFDGAFTAATPIDPAFDFLASSSDATSFEFGGGGLATANCGRYIIDTFSGDGGFAAGFQGVSGLAAPDPDSFAGCSSAAAVPLPQTAAMFWIGSVMLGFVSIRRRKLALA